MSLRPDVFVCAVIRVRLRHKVARRASFLSLVPSVFPLIPVPVEGTVRIGGALPFSGPNCSDRRACPPGEWRRRRLSGRIGDQTGWDVVAHSPIHACIVQKRSRRHAVALNLILEHFAHCFLSNKEAFVPSFATS